MDYLDILAREIIKRDVAENLVRVSNRAGYLVKGNNDFLEVDIKKGTRISEFLLSLDFPFFAEAYLGEYTRVFYFLDLSEGAREIIVNGFEPRLQNFEYKGYRIFTNFKIFKYITLQTHRFNPEVYSTHFKYDDIAGLKREKIRTYFKVEEILFDYSPYVNKSESFQITGRILLEPLIYKPQKGYFVCEESPGYIDEQLLFEAFEILKLIENVATYKEISIKVSETVNRINAHGFLWELTSFVFKLLGEIIGEEKLNYADFKSIRDKGDIKLLKTKIETLLLNVL